MKASEMKELLWNVDDNANIIVRKQNRNPFRKLLLISAIRKTENLTVNGTGKTVVAIIVK